jgi:Helitron helicase-like domain at N-terminus
VRTAPIAYTAVELGVTSAAQLDPIPLPTPQVAPVAEVDQSIGRFVPYLSDANIEPINIDASSAAPVEADAQEAQEAAPDPEEEDPFIAAEQVERSTSTYRPRARGPAKFASRRDYINYHLQRRGNLRRHHPLLSYGKLTQKYLIHQAWLNWHNEEDHQRRLQSQPEFRRTLRKEFIQYHQRRLQRRNEADPNVERHKIGRVFQMPATARQSAKNVHLNITRAMAIRKAVNPKCGMFITYTFNCKCPELQEMIGARANPADYPDLCCRLASVKFRQLLELVSGPKGIFGPVKAWVWSLEYQVALPVYDARLQP